MATKVQMPKLSDTMEEGVILKWRFKEGDKVKQGEILVEIESDKADMELEAYDSGVLRKIFVPEGGKARIGAPIAIIGEAGEDIAPLLKETSSPGESPTKPAPSAPEPTPGASVSTPPPPPAIAASPALPTTTGRVKASPLARRLAEDNRLNLGALSGSGPQGRIVKRDIESAIRTQKPFTEPSPAVRETKDLALSAIRKTIAKRMTESKQQIPHFYVTIELDMEPAISFRTQLNSTGDVKISFTDILVKASAMALMRHPMVNASYLGDGARQYGFANISVAVALDEGLVTPVLRNCEQKGLEQLNRELRDLVDRARNRKLKPEEYTGGNLAISNLGMFNVDDFVAIINPPEGSILAVGSIQEKPVVRNGNIVVGHTMKITMSADHRIIDGAVAARFLQDLRHFVENPALLLFGQ